MLASQIAHLSPTDRGMNAALHLGTLLSLLLIFRKDVWRAFQGFFQSVRRPTTTAAQLFFWLVVASLPSMGVGLLLHIMGGSVSPCVAGLLSLVFGTLLWLVDANALADKAVPSYHSLKEALFLGGFQALALFSGVSRLGICLTAARLMGYGLGAAAPMAFLMGIPPMAGALMLNLPKITTPWLPFLAATALSFAINLPLVLFFLHWTSNRRSLFPFFLYRVLIGILLMALC